MLFTGLDPIVPALSLVREDPRSFMALTTGRLPAYLPRQQWWRFGRSEVVVHDNVGL